MTLAVPSRRGFLRGLGAIIAAPAIVRVASLMPVSVTAYPRLEVGMTVAGIGNGLLTINMITREAIKLWQMNCEYLAFTDERFARMQHRGDVS